MKSKLLNFFNTKELVSSEDANDFDIFGLSEKINRSLLEKGYRSPTPIQQKVIPIILDNHDLLAVSQTGTGKTAAFTLPILQKLSVKQSDKKRKIRALILTPTRELAAQIDESVRTYGQHLPLSSTVVFGGVNINPQKAKLRQGVDVLTATPGRLLDLYQQQSLSFSDLDILVLDEADRMLDMGFIHDVRKIISLLPKNRQTLLFSATFSKDIIKLSQQFLNHPKEVSVAPKNTAAPSVQQSIYRVEKEQKPELLFKLIEKNNWFQVLVFTQTKHRANKLSKFLEKNGVSASAIHGNKSQSARTKALHEFKNGNLQVLVATDIASRGLDINELPQVVNYELPHVPEDYVHRIGRTGRAGASGQAVSLISPDESKQLKSIEKLIKQKLESQSLNSIPLTNVKKNNKRKFYKKPR